MSSDDGKSRGFGFVCYEDPDAAERACDDMHAKDMNGKTLFVGRAQKRNERQTELRRKFEQMKIERLNRYQGVNLYVKNLDDTIDDERLRKEFAPYGTITSAKVMTEGGRNKGGFQTSLGKYFCTSCCSWTILKLFPSLRFRFRLLLIPGRGNQSRN